MRIKTWLVTAILASCLVSCSTLGVDDIRQAGLARASEPPVSQSEITPLFVSQTNQVIEPVNASALSGSSVANFRGANSFVWLPDNKGAALSSVQTVILLPMNQTATSAQVNSPTASQGISTTLPSLLFAAQGRAMLVWVSEGDKIQILDTTVASASPITTQSDAPVTGLTLAPTGEQVAYATFDRQLITYRPGDEQNAHSWKTSAWLANLAYSPDTNQLAGADLANFTLYFMDVNSGEVLRTLTWSDSVTSALYGVYLSPDWGQAAWVSQSSVQLMDVSSGQSGPLLVHPNVVNALAWSPDSQLVATGAGTMAEGGLEPAVFIWEAGSGDLLNTLVPPEAVQSLSFSPDGRQLAVLTTNGDLQTWSVSR